MGTHEDISLRHPSQRCEDRVFNVWQNLQQQQQRQPGVVQRVRDSLRQKSEGCIAVDGRHDEYVV